MTTEGHEKGAKVKFETDTSAVTGTYTWKPE